MLKKIQTSGMTLDKFKTEVIGNLTGDLPQSATRAMTTATFMTRLETDTSFIGQTWRSQTDQTLRSTPTVDTQMLDAMMRDPGSAGKILDRIAAGGAGKPVILLAGTQNKSIWQELPFIGIDKDGNVRVVGGDGLGFSRAAGQSAWNSTQSTNPGAANYKPDIEWNSSSHQWKIKLADGSDFVLGDTAVAQININGYDVTLDANKGGQYAFAGDGTLTYEVTTGSNYSPPEAISDNSRQCKN